MPRTTMMTRTVLVYGGALACGAFLLQWLEHQFVVQLYATEIYIVLLAILFTGLGVWFGTRLGRGKPDASFSRNDKIIDTLGLTPRELEVLELLAEGASNRGIAKRLYVAPSTVKTHLVHLYQKLAVSRRTEAVQKARTLRIIP
ncbi:MAG TPA: LuxR C-terminal-related transcriptional regulator [Woeseiaceae bacterium]|nr:LuxR C-terminal-related transcriptional regulator [Woeseiaceae bacterium]